MQPISWSAVICVAGGDNPGMGPYDAPPTSAGASLSCPAPESGTGLAGSVTINLGVVKITYKVENTAD